MPSPLRLNPELLAAAKKESALQKRSIPKQIEFWAELGKAVEHVIDLADVFAVLKGLKKIRVEPVTSSPVAPEEVFEALDQGRESGALAGEVTAAPFYYEASPTHPGFLDRVDAGSGKRQTGTFRQGEFEVIHG